MEWLIVILISAVLIGGAVMVGLKQGKKLVAEGKIISRSTKFMEEAEEFALAPVNPNAVAALVKSFDYSDMHAQMQANAEQQIFKFTGRAWTAQLRYVGKNSTHVVYRFEFTAWKTRNGMAQDPVNMNKLLTAVEKMFMGFDPNTQVRTVPLEFKTKHSFL